MRKTRLLNPSVQNRRLRGLVNTYYDSKRKIIVTRKWPPKRPGGTPAQKAWRKLWGDAAHAIVTQEPMITDFAKKLVVGTDFIWRDICLSAALGNLVSSYDINGNWIVPGRAAMTYIMALLDSISAAVGGFLIRTSTGWQSLQIGTFNQVLGVASNGLPAWGNAADILSAEISPMLDTIGSDEGTILYRGATAWMVLEPGTSGQVLTSNGAAAPSWQAGGGGGGGGGILNRQNVTQAGSGTVTCNDNCNWLSLTVTGFATVTVTLPAAPTDGQVCTVFTKTPVNDYNELTINPAAGQTMAPQTSQSSTGGAHGQGWTFVWDAANSNWDAWNAIQFNS